MAKGKSTARQPATAHEAPEHAPQRLPVAPGDPGPFFARLAKWDQVPRAVDAFGRQMNRSISTPQPVFYVYLYRLLIDKLLELLRLPRSDGGSEWEWKTLYQFGQTVDPHYFTERAIDDLLRGWSVIGNDRRQTMVSVLSGFFHLRRGGFPSCYPSPLMPVAELERWIRIFPPEWAWESLRILRAMGFVTLSSQHAYRASRRFNDGEFEPAFNATTLRQWFAEVHRAGSLGQDVPEQVQPYAVTFVAAAFADATRAMGVDGYCGDLPDCGRCPLSDECAWYNAPASSQRGAREILTLARRGHLEHLRIDELLQGLCNLPESAAEQVRGRLGSTSWRRLAGFSAQELDEAFGFQPHLPEQVAVTIELCRRFNEERMEVGDSFQTPWDVFKHFRIRLRELKQEQFIVVLLDNKKRYLSDLVITKGTLNSSPVHPREVFNAAIREHAASIVIVHNHPSGDPKPSREDIHVTQQLIKVGELVGIPVVDHVIIAADLYVSMLEQGLMKG